MDIPLNKVNQAIDIIKKDYFPLEVRGETIQLVKSNPVKIVSRFELKSNN